MILLDNKEITEAIDKVYPSGKGAYQANVADKAIVKATGKKILIQLQAIYNLPDEGMFHKQMGEFIQELNEEVSDNIC